MSSPSDATHEARPHQARLTIEGSPGPTESRPLREAALAALAAGGDVAVDCGSAEHLHAAVLQILLCLRRDLEASGRRLHVINVSPAVQRFLDVTGVSKLLQPEVAR